MNKVRTAITAAVTAISLSTMAAPTWAAEASGGDTGSPVINNVTENTQVKDVQKGMAPATTWPISNHTFNPGHPSFTNDASYGKFTGQVHYASPQTMAWSLRLKPAVTAAATGSMSEVASVTKNGKKYNYHDSHPAVGPSYILHSSIKTVTGGPYVLTIRESFPIKGGTRTITTTFTFTITFT